LIDAFPKTYLSKKFTPFIYNLSQHGVLTHIEPLFAFKGIETTIFTGLWPSVHNIWTEFCLLNTPIQSKNDILFRTIIKVIDVLPFGEYKAKLRYVVEKLLFKKSHKTPNLIPAEATKFFQASQHKEITEPGAVGELKTIYDVFRENGVRYVFIEPWISGDAGVLRKVKKLIKQDTCFDFWYLKLNHLDHMGHKFGPSPLMFSEQLQRIDEYVKDIVTLMQKKNPNLNIIILSDHGMSEVRKSVDLLRDLGKLESLMYKDYVVFADSTILRFWFFSEKTKREVHKYLKQTDFGHILTLSEKERLKMPLDNKYGQTIYVMDEGYIINPCFFHSRTVKGMHGYAYPKTLEAFPILIMNDKIAENFQISEPIFFSNISQIILYCYSQGKLRIS
jgi:predicted AlkP superfamily pyrophosphatase or phosphodiesterase